MEKDRDERRRNLHPQDGLNCLTKLEHSLLQLDGILSVAVESIGFIYEQLYQWQGRPFGSSMASGALD
jgi:hypothetical protein